MAAQGLGMALLGLLQGYMGLWHALEPAARAEGLAHGAVAA